MKKHKQWMSAVMALIFLFSAICPAWAREGNYGSKSWEAFAGGALAGAVTDIFIFIGGGEGGTYAAAAGSIASNLVGNYMYFNYYSEYGEKSFSFKVFGTEVVITKGQVASMIAGVVAGVAAGAVSGALSGAGEGATEGATDGAVNGAAEGAGEATAQAVVATIMDQAAQNLAKEAAEQTARKIVEEIIKDLVESIVKGVVVGFAKLIISRTLEELMVDKWGLDRGIASVLAGAITAVGGYMVAVMVAGKGETTKGQKMSDAEEGVVRAMDKAGAEGVDTKTDVPAELDVKVVSGEGKGSDVKVDAAQIQEAAPVEGNSNQVTLADGRVVEIKGEVKVTTASGEVKTIGVMELYKAAANNGSYTLSDGTVVKLNVGTLGNLVHTQAGGSEFKLPGGGTVTVKGAEGQRVVQSYLRLAAKAESIIAQKGDLLRAVDGRVLSDMGVFERMVEGGRTMGLRPFVTAGIQAGILLLMDYQSYNGTDKRKKRNNNFKMIIARGAGSLASDAFSNWDSVNSFYAGTNENPWRTRPEGLSYAQHLGHSFATELGSTLAEAGFNELTYKWDLNTQYGVQGVVHLLAGSTANVLISKYALRDTEESAFSNGSGNIVSAIFSNAESQFLASGEAVIPGLTLYNHPGTGLGAYQGYLNSLDQFGRRIDMLMQGVSPTQSIAMDLGSTLTAQAAGSIGHSFGYAVANNWLPQDYRRFAAFVSNKEEVFSAAKGLKKLEEESDELVKGEYKLYGKLFSLKAQKTFAKEKEVAEIQAELDKTKEDLKVNEQKREQVNNDIHTINHNIIKEHKNLAPISTSSRMIYYNYSDENGYGKDKKVSPETKATLAEIEGQKMKDAVANSGDYKIRTYYLYDDMGRPLDVLRYETPVLAGTEMRGVQQEVTQKNGKNNALIAAHYEQVVLREGAEKDAQLDEDQKKALIMKFKALAEEMTTEEAKLKEMEQAEAEGGTVDGDCSVQGLRDHLESSKQYFIQEIKKMPITTRADMQAVMTALAEEKKSIAKSIREEMSKDGLEVREGDLELQKAIAANPVIRQLSMIQGNLPFEKIYMDTKANEIAATESDFLGIGANKDGAQVSAQDLFSHLKDKGYINERGVPKPLSSPAELSDLDPIYKGMEGKIFDAFQRVGRRRIDSVRDTTTFVLGVRAGNPKYKAITYVDGDGSENLEKVEQVLGELGKGVNIYYDQLILAERTTRDRFGRMRQTDYYGVQYKPSQEGSGDWEYGKLDKFTKHYYGAFGKTASETKDSTEVDSDQSIKTKATIKKEETRIETVRETVNESREVKEMVSVPALKNHSDLYKKGERENRAVKYKQGEGIMAISEDKIDEMVKAEPERFAKMKQEANDLNKEFCTKGGFKFKPINFDALWGKQLLIMMYMAEAPDGSERTWDDLSGVEKLGVFKGITGARLATAPLYEGDGVPQDWRTLKRNPGDVAPYTTSFIPGTNSTADRVNMNDPNLKAIYAPSFDKEITTMVTEQVQRDVQKEVKVPVTEEVTISEVALQQPNYFYEANFYETGGDHCPYVAPTSSLIVSDIRSGSGLMPGGFSGENDVLGNVRDAVKIEVGNAIITELARSLEGKEEWELPIKKDKTQKESQLKEDIKKRIPEIVNTVVDDNLKNNFKEEYSKIKETDESAARVKSRAYSDADIYKEVWTAFTQTEFYRNNMGDQDKLGEGWNVFQSKVQDNFQFSSIKEEQPVCLAQDDIQLINNEANTFANSREFTQNFGQHVDFHTIMTAYGRVAAVKLEQTPVMKEVNAMSSTDLNNLLRTPAARVQQVQYFEYDRINDRTMRRPLWNIGTTYNPTPDQFNLGVISPNIVLSSDRDIELNYNGKTINVAAGQTFEQAVQKIPDIDMEEFKNCFSEFINDNKGALYKEFGYDGERSVTQTIYRYDSGIESEVRKAVDLAAAQGDFKSQDVWNSLVVPVSKNINGENIYTVRQDIDEWGEKIEKPKDKAFYHRHTVLNYGNLDKYIKFYDVGIGFGGPGGTIDINRDISGSTGSGGFTGTGFPAQ